MPGSTLIARLPLIVARPQRYPKPALQQAWSELSRLRDRDHDHDHSKAVPRNCICSWHAPNVAPLSLAHRAGPRKLSCSERQRQHTPHIQPTRSSVRRVFASAINEETEALAGSCTVAAWLRRSTPLSTVHCPLPSRYQPLSNFTLLTPRLGINTPACPIHLVDHGSLLPVPTGCLTVPACACPTPLLSVDHGPSVVKDRRDVRGMCFIPFC